MRKQKTLGLFEKYFESMVEKNNEWYMNKYEKSLVYMQDNNISDPCQLEVLDVTEEGYKIINATADLVTVGMPLACSLISEEYSDKYIIVDDAFEELLSDTCKNVVIAHERGHLVYGHLENATGILDDIEKEIEADSLAVKLYGKETTALALEELFATVVSLLTIYHEDTIKEIANIMEIRINAILNK